MEKYDHLKFSGKKLSELLRERKMTQHELAVLCGKTDGCVSNWIHGISSPRFENFADICRILCVKPETISDRVESPSLEVLKSLIDSFCERLSNAADRYPSGSEESSKARRGADIVRGCMELYEDAIKKSLD